MTEAEDAEEKQDKVVNTRRMRTRGRKVAKVVVVA